MAGFFKKIWKAGGWLKGWVRDFRVPGIGVHVMTDAALAERIKTAERAEREQIDRILAVKRALLGWPRKMPARLKGRTMTQMANIIRDEVYYVKDVFSGKKLKRKK